jgi:phloretin hydrolase
MASRFPQITNEHLRSLPHRELTAEELKKPYVKYHQKPLAEIPQELLDIINAGSCSPDLALPIEKRSDMLLPGCQAVENGFCRMADGSGFVATKVIFPDATPEMFDWWFNFQAVEDLRCSMWQPTTHIASSCRDYAPYYHTATSGISLKTRNYNRDHIPVEGLVDLDDGMPLIIRFFAPEEFGLNMLQTLVSPVKSLSCASCLTFGDGARMLWGDYAVRLLADDPNATIPFNVLLHTIRVVEGGCELRSRYWIGKGLKDGKAFHVDLPAIIDVEQLAWAMMRHSMTEFHNLALFLPQLYKEEGPEVKL